MPTPAPVTPVHDLDRVSPLLLELLRKAVFEGTAGRIIGLSGGFDKRHDGGEEEHEVKLLIAEDPVHIHAGIDFGR